MGCATFLWFAFVAQFLSIGMIRRQFEKIQSGFTRAMGGVLILLGLKVALSTRE
jgi:threonine/homoserine/homoserine lactone efflux protein